MVATILLAAAVAVALPDRHVRSTDSVIQGVLARGQEQSPTLRRLVEVLDRSDVIVYLEMQQRRHEFGAYLSHHIVIAGGNRYLRVKLRAAGPLAQMAARIAHELQHAVEVAQSPDARDVESVQRLFRQIGLSTACDPSRCFEAPAFETQAALDVQHAVRSEIAEARRAVR